MLIRNLLLAAFSLTAFACSSAGVPSEDVATGAAADPLRKKEFVDAPSFFTAGEDIDAWYTLMARLKKNFDDVCGDTFCEGDYSNYESLGFRCSVESKSGLVGQCVWILAASTDEVSATTGNIEVQPKNWRCRMPIGPRTLATDLLHSLSVPNSEPIFTALPQTEKSLYEGLGDCL